MIVSPRSLALVTGFLLIAGPAMAQDVPAPTDTAAASTAPTSTAPTSIAAAKPADDPARPICRRQATTGSRLPGPRTCRTKAEWEANDRDSQDAVRRVQDNRRTVS